MTIQKIKGTRDVYGKEMEKWHRVEEIMHYVAGLYHFTEMRTPVFEKTELFKRDNDSSDVVNKEMYTFTDQGGRSITLRPEVTAGIVRSIIENKLYATEELPLKYYYIGNNFRSERPQKGRYRIFNQFGVEAIGAKNPYLDAEMIALGYTILTALGLKQFAVQINTLGDETSRSAYKKALKAHFEPHLPELCSDCHRRFQQNPLRILDCKVDREHPSFKNIPALKDYLTEDSKTYYEQFKAALAMLGIPYQEDDRLVRGLDYYSEVVFEIVGTREGAGSQATIFGGGRYDNLVSALGGPKLEGIGFAIGMERLILALDEEGVDLTDPNHVDIYFMPLDKQYQKEALALMTIARSAGYSCEMDYFGRSFKAQFKSVDKQGATVVAILGEDEVTKSQVTLKHITTQQQVTVPFNEMIVQLDHWVEAAEHDHNHDHDHHHHHEDDTCDCDHEHEGHCHCGHHH